MHSLNERTDYVGRIVNRDNWTLVYFKLLMLAGDPTLLIVLLLSIMFCYHVFTVDFGVWLQSY